MQKILITSMNGITNSDIIKLLEKYHIDFLIWRVTYKFNNQKIYWHSNFNTICPSKISDGNLKNIIQVFINSHNFDNTITLYHKLYFTKKSLKPSVANYFVLEYILRKDIEELLNN